MSQALLKLNVSIGLNFDQWIVDLSQKVTQLCPIPYDPMDCSPPGSSVLYHLPELALTCVHGVGDAVQPACPLMSPSPAAFSLSRRHGLIQ